jgi:hypothetical protein
LCRTASIFSFASWTFDGLDLDFLAAFPPVPITFRRVHFRRVAGIECQADSHSSVSSDCTVAWGVCNHAFHFHCISRWLTTRSVCPLDNQAWDFQKYVRAAPPSFVFLSFAFLYSIGRQMRSCKATYITFLVLWSFLLFWSQG